ncbi:hypothetical protein P7C73_g4216, partial [Tremellales sp. Uapishka_1]
MARIDSSSIDQSPVKNCTTIVDQENGQYIPLSAIQTRPKSNNLPVLPATPRTRTSRARPQHSRSPQVGQTSKTASESESDDLKRRVEGRREVSSERSSLQQKNIPSTSASLFRLSPPKEPTASPIRHLRYVDPILCRSPRRRKRDTGESTRDPFFDPSSYVVLQIPDQLSRTVNTPEEGEGRRGGNRGDCEAAEVTVGGDSATSSETSPTSSLPLLDLTRLRRTPLTARRRFTPTPLKGLEKLDLQSIKAQMVPANEIYSLRFQTCDGGENSREDQEEVEQELGLDFGALNISESPAVSPTQTVLSPTIPIYELESFRMTEELEVDDEVVNLPRALKAKKRIVVSDSESEPEEGHQYPVDSESETANIRHLPRSHIVDLTGSDDEDNSDDTYGSLRDFIVDDDEDDDYILHFSPPPKPSLTLPDFRSLCLDDTPPPTPTGVRGTTRTPARPQKTKKQLEAERGGIAQDIFDELDRKVFDSKLGVQGAGAAIEWSSRLLTTAGTATESRKKLPDGTTKREAKIVLSIKVLSEKSQILNTVAHEMCHLASWIISNERKNPHGKVFKSCYQRHSKSIDPSKQTCGRCRSKLAPLFATKASSAFQIYLKENMAHAKIAHSKAPHGEVMRALSERWKEAGAEGDHAAFWRAKARSQQVL